MKLLSKDITKKILGVAAVLALVIYVIVEWKSIFSIQISPLNLFLMLSVTFIFLFTNGVFLKIIMSHYGIKLSYLESLGLSVLNTAGNYFSFFFGGTAMKAFYLRKKYDFQYSKFIESLMATYIVVFLMSSIAALMAIFTIYFTMGNFLFIPFLIFSGSTFSLILLMFLPHLFINLKLKKVAKAAKEWKNLSSNRSLMIKLSIVAFINIILTASLTLLKFGSIGVSLNYIQSIYVSSITGLALFVNITPASLGIAEAFTIYATQVFSVSPMEAVLASGVERAATLIIVIPLSLILGRKLLFKGKHSSKKIMEIESV